MTITEQVRHVLKRCPDVDWSVREIIRAVGLEFGVVDKRAVRDVVQRMWVQGELGRDESRQSNRYFVIEGWKPKRAPNRERQEVGQ